MSAKPSSKHSVRLDNHVVDAKPTDLVIIAVSKGKSYSITLVDGRLTDIDDTLAFELRSYALREELNDRIRMGYAA